MNEALINYYLARYDKVKNNFIFRRKMSLDQAEDCLHNLYFKCRNTTASIEEARLPKYFAQMVKNMGKEHYRSMRNGHNRFFLEVHSEDVIESLQSDVNLEDDYYRKEQMQILNTAIAKYSDNRMRMLKKQVRLLVGVEPSSTSHGTAVVKIPYGTVKVKVPYEKIKTKIDKSLLAELFKTHSMNDIQKEYGWSKNTIIKYRKLYKLEPKRGYKKGTTRKKRSTKGEGI